jgi:hypothetical protein
MALISALITEIRTDIADDDSTRFSDTQILNMMKRAIRRANRIAIRNKLQFAKKSAAITCVADQAYVTLSTSITDFDVMIKLFLDDSHEEIPFRTELEWETLKAGEAELANAFLDYANDKIQFNGTPSTAETLTCWYFPTVDPSAYTTASSTPWSGRLDDIIMEYVALRLRNIDEMDTSFDQSLLNDMETQILETYGPNSPTMVETTGWTG